MFSSFQPPVALLHSDDYRVLNDNQKRNFEKRLRTYEDLAAAGVSAAVASDNELLSTIDDMQLDVLSLMSTVVDPDSAVSAYKIQSSWTFECDRRAMPQCIIPQARDFLREPFIGVAASKAEVKKWLKTWASLIHLTLGRFSSSSTYTEAITQLIVIDALLAAYLVFAACFRMTGDCDIQTSKSPDAPV